MRTPPTPQDPFAYKGGSLDNASSRITKGLSQRIDFPSVVVTHLRLVSEKVPEDPTTVKLIHQQHTLKHALPPLSPPPVCIPTSMSTPTVMFYKHLNSSAVDSQFSTTDDVASSTDVTSTAATVEYLRLKSEESLGPDGMPILQSRRLRRSMGRQHPYHLQTQSPAPHRLPLPVRRESSHQQRPAEQLPQHQ